MNEIEPKPGGPLENGLAREGATPASAQTPPRVPDHELLRLIGSGAYGEVWLARTIMGEHRAVKVVYRRSFEHDRPYEREFAGIQKFEPISRSHASQVDILHVGRNEAEGYFYYVMELADDAKAGVAADVSSQVDFSRALTNAATYQPNTLKSELRQRGRFPAAECVKLGLALTTALEHLHKSGLVHRDVKPSNIIFVNGEPKLADIGLVTAADATRSYVGTLGFAPHEGPGTVTADLYSLGKVLYEAATGRDRQEFPELPTRLGGSPQEEAELVELNQVILKACDNDPSHRYQNAEAMRADLTVLESGESLLRKRGAKRRLALLAKAGAVIVVLAAGAALLLRQQLANQERLSTAPAPAQGDSASPQPADEIPNSQFQFESFVDAIRSKAGRYPRLTPGTGARTNPFTPFRLNGQPIHWGGEYFDAVRFTTPSENGLDMVFAFNMYNRHLAWGLIPLEGTMQGGFRRLWQQPASRYENVPAPAPDGQNLARRTSAETQLVARHGATNEALRRVLEATAPGIQVVSVMGLPGQFLKPKRDYLLWFKFQKNKAAEFQIAMSFVPPGVSSETNLVSLEKVLGLVLKAEPVADTNSPRSTNK